MKQITVDKEKLERYIATECWHYRATADDTTGLCNKKTINGCNLELAEKVLLDCPRDCPHMNEYKWKRCTYGKCSTVKNAIKGMMA